MAGHVRSGKVILDQVGLGRVRLTFEICCEFMNVYSDVTKI